MNKFKVFTIDFWSMVSVQKLMVLNTLIMLGLFFIVGSFISKNVIEIGDSNKKMIGGYEEKQSRKVMESHSTDMVDQVIIEISIVLFLMLVILVIFQTLFYFILKKKLIRTGKEIKVVSSEVTLVTKEIKSTSVGLDKAADNQMVVTGETSRALEDLIDKISNNMEMARQEVKIFQEVKLNSENSFLTMKNLRDFFKEILNQNDKIKGFVGLIQNIRDKTKVIDEIVFQTKLLSFNASVEAERAGEHGRGFSVVAQEIGSLASLSGKAAEEIGRIVNNAVSEVSVVTEANEKKIAAGDEQIEKNYSMLQKIVESAGGGVENSQNLMSSYEVQSKNTETAGKQLSQIESEAQKTKKSSEKNLHSSEILERNVDKLNSYVENIQDINRF